jgi:hypothetical protein
MVVSKVLPSKIVSEVDPATWRCSSFPAAIDGKIFGLNHHS